MKITHTDSDTIVFKQGTYEFTLAYDKSRNAIKLIETSGMNDLVVRPESANSIMLLMQDERKNLVRSITNSFNKYSKKNGNAALCQMCAEVVVKWKDDESEETALISFSGLYDEDPNDENILFYVDTLDEFIDLFMPDNGEDFQIIQFNQFTI